MLGISCTSPIALWVKALRTRWRSAVARWRRCSAVRPGARRVVAPCQSATAQPARVRPNAVSRMIHVGQDGPSHRHAARSRSIQNAGIANDAVGFHAKGMEPPQKTHSVTPFSCLDRLLDAATSRSMTGWGGSCPAQSPPRHSARQSRNPKKHDGAPRLACPYHPWPMRWKPGTVITSQRVCYAHRWPQSSRSRPGS
jgi:hypothetical protein